MRQSYDELMAEQAEKERLQQEKADRYLLRRKRMTMKLCLCSGVAALLVNSCLIAMKVAGFYYFLFMTPFGFLCGYATGKLNVGVAGSIALFGGINIAALLLFYFIGGSESGVGFFMALLVLLVYSIAGGLCGLWNALFDDEHRQI